MYKLIQGHESAERLELLLQLTSISSESIKAALASHFIKGYSEKDAAFINDTQLPNLSRAIAALNEKAAIVEKIKEIDWPERSKVIT